MSKPELTVAGTIRTLRIIVIAMLLGVLLFVCVATFVNLGEDPERESMLLVVLGALVVGVTIAHPILRRAALAELRRRTAGDTPSEAEPKLLGGYTTLTLQTAALIEGPTLFAGVIYLLSADPLALLPAAVGVLLLLARWPSEERYRAFAVLVAGPG